MSERFEVVTAAPVVSAHLAGKAQPEPLNAHVVDRLYNDHVVATYRSDQPSRKNGNGATIGNDEALWRARAHAKHMNAVYG